MIFYIISLKIKLIRDYYKYNACIYNNNMEQIIQNVNTIINLYEQFGGSDYIGESQTQLEHMTRAAMLAEEFGEHTDMILAAFLHDIGHLIEINNDTIKMGSLGIMNHELIARDYLIEKGFDENIANIVGNHVKAKRYLVTKYPEYKTNLSEASRQTLLYQKNTMSQEEMTEFESDPLFNKSLKLRFYDDQSKLLSKSIKPLDYYRNLMIEYLSESTNNV
ncbi:putative HD phosphohydrolase [Acanthamoeba castellanii mamavirus]|nr:putative HD phosphohydrolase [Acanthamoeba castellanii mamavirus]EJN40868.1 putative HD phosphohydrolase [Acanthamoeba polyphaga lentillevirus]